MKAVKIVGIGIGNNSSLTIEAKEAIESADVLIGARRMVEAYKYLSKPSFCSYKNNEIVDYIEKSSFKNIVVLVSGDVGFFSAARKLKDSIKGAKISLIAGISSMVYFASKIGMAWDDMKIVSMHAKDNKFLGSVMTNEKTFILAGGEKSVQDICAILCEHDFSNLKVYVGENLSYENERIIEGTAAELKLKEFANLTVMVIVNDEPLNNLYTTHGIEDEEFIRGRVPMTKSEIRNVSLSKLKLRGNDVCWDIGAGTGSVSIEMALKNLEGIVYAIEKKEEAVELIKQNKKKFKVNNLKVISGLAPEALRDLPAPDRVFIGGSAGNMDEIIKIILEKNPLARFVITAITLETVAESIAALKKYNITDSDIVHLAVGKSKKVAGYNMMMGLNPVYIITGQGEIKDE